MEGLTLFGVGVVLGYLVKAVATADLGRERRELAFAQTCDALLAIPEVTSVWRLGPWVLYALVNDEARAHESGAYEQLVGVELTSWSFGSAELRVRQQGCVLPDGCTRVWGRA